MSEVFPKTFQTYPVPVPGRVLLNMTSSRMLFLSKVLDFGESIVIYSFYTEFSFLALVRVNIFFGKCASYGRNNSHFSTRREKLARKRELA